MRIHALTTGTVRLKAAFLHARTGWRRQPALFLPGEWSGPVPIHCWAVEHNGRVVLVDTGETSGVNDVPFARFDVSPEVELPGALAAAGLAIGDVATVVLTHMHGDHMDGAVHIGGPVLVHDAELAYTRTLGARFFQRAAPARADWGRVHVRGSRRRALRRLRAQPAVDRRRAHHGR